MCRNYSLELVYRVKVCLSEWKKYEPGNLREMTEVIRN